MNTNPVTPKVSWRPAELPGPTGLSLAFWRKMIRLGKVRSRKIGGAVIVLDADLRIFLSGESAEKEPASAGAEAHE